MTAAKSALLRESICDQGQSTFSRALDNQMEDAAGALEHQRSSFLPFILEPITGVCPSWLAIGRRIARQRRYDGPSNEAAHTAGRAASCPSRGVCVATAAKSSLPPD